MCLYPKLIKNPKYRANKKNGGVIPAINDLRVMAVPIGCGRCAECIKKKAREWKVRLFEEVKVNKSGHFITLTFSNESYTELAKEFKDTKGYELDNAIATLAMRRFLERWRKHNKKSVRHWFITELGHKGTENIHLHGFIWENPKSNINYLREIKERWTYGHVWCGYVNKRTYVNERTINYVTKYITKQDAKHKYYIPKVLTSKGIGNNYLNSGNSRNNRYTGKDTKEYYVTPSGHKLALPMYYRNKLYNDNERESLWINKLDENVRYVDGKKIDISKNDKLYQSLRNTAREKYARLGYNTNYNWKEDNYENERRVLLQNKRIIVKEEYNNNNDDDLSKYTNLSLWI